MEITKELLESIYLNCTSIEAKHFIDGMLFMAKELKSISVDEMQSWIAVNEELYEENKYDQPHYDI